MSRREQEHLIQTVYPGSIAEELEIEPGDVLLKINGQIGRASCRERV